MELIDREALGVGRCNPDIMPDQAYAAGWNGLLNIINRTPTIDAAPVVHGRWITKNDGQWGQRRNYCSACGEHSGMISKRRFCPNCGALMDLPEGEEARDDG